MIKVFIVKKKVTKLILMYTPLKKKLTLIL